jgi:phosphinothricin acetyltransferase
MEDASGIAGIYNYYITHTPITFEEEPVASGVMGERIRAVIPTYPWFVWEEDGEVAGYAYAHAWRQQAAYRWAAEDTIYVKPGWERRGIGRRLLGGLVGELREREIHVLMAVITTPNPASEGLHEGLGFQQAGQFSEIGFKLGTWRDVGYWELILRGAGPGAAEGAAPRSGAAEGGAGVDRKAEPQVWPEDYGGRGEASPPKKKGDRR